MKRAHDGLEKGGLLSDARLLLQIHDELLYEVKEEAVSRARIVIEDAMEHAVEFPVPITVSVKKGSRFGSMEDIK